MTRSQWRTSTSLVLLALATGSSQAQSAKPALADSFTITAPAAQPWGGFGQEMIPDVSLEKPGDAGLRSHTHYRAFMPAGTAAAGTFPKATNPPPGPPYSGYFYETPASLACIYHIVPASSGCNPNTVTTNAAGGSKVVVLVDAYDDSTAAADLQVYSTQFGLPKAKFEVVYATGTQPAANSGWAIEESIDIEMAHAMAPDAKIVLVEAATNSNVDLDAAIDVATQIVMKAGGGEISMSFGSSEASGETARETHFAGKTGVVFFASTGDSPGVEYPSASPNVVAVGGTSVSRDTVYGTGAFRQETSWASGGGGLSAYFGRPFYQRFVDTPFQTRNRREVPDIAAIANPVTGVWVYCGTGCGTAGWRIYGGTSVASPVMAGLTNNAGHFRENSQAQLRFMYGQAGKAPYFNVGYGICGPYAGYLVAPASAASPPKGFDLCTGLGAPRGLSGL